MEISALVQQCTPTNVSPETMQIVMQGESTLRPYAIGYKIVRQDDGKVFFLNVQPRTREQAISWARWLTENKFDFDAGAVQVNSRNFKAYGLRYLAAFDPCLNISRGAAILHECYSRALPKCPDPQTALRRALSCYQSGNFTTGFKTGYVQKLVGLAIK